MVQMQGEKELLTHLQALIPCANLKEAKALSKAELLPCLCKLYQDQKISLKELHLHFKLESEEFLSEFAKFCHLEFIDLKEFELEEGLNSYFSLKQMQKFAFIPFKEDEKFIFLAFAKPYDKDTIITLQNHLKHKLIKAFLANELIIAKKLENLDFKESFQKLVAEVKAQLRQNDISAEQSAISKLFELIATKAVLQKSSDIHLEPNGSNALVRFRIDGILQIFTSLDLQIYTALMLYIKLLAHLNVAEQRKAQDGSFLFNIQGSDFDFRLSSLPLIYGESLVLRILERKKDFLSLENLHFSPKNLSILQKNIYNPYGMILLTGPTGSGKSTTLYACLNEIKSENKKIITAEDPIEYRLELVQQILLNEKAGLDFNNALRAILRQDPDVIMIGEIRDEQSLDIAIKASLTGHLVFSTLHTNDSISALFRMIDMNAKAYLLANALNIIIAQRLVRKLCDHCKFTYESELEGFEGEFFKAGGCEYCHNSGYVGRELVEELLYIDENLSELIRGKATKLEILNYAKTQGFETMLDRGLQKAKEGKTSLDELIRVLR